MTPADEATSSPQRARGPAARALRRMLALFVGLVATVVLLEIGLQTASLFVSGERGAEGGDVLCQGDSNTYGLHLPTEDAYPAQLEQLIAEHAAAPLEVANLGVPGKTSWVIQEQVEQDLARFAPRAVLVWCGANDFSSLRPERGEASLLDRSRVVRMVRRLTARHAAPQQEPPVPALPAPGERDRRDAGAIEGRSEMIDEHSARRMFLDREDEVRPFVTFFGAPETALAQRWLYEDLLAIVARVRAAGSTPLLVLYPVDDKRLGQANEAIAQAAAECGARLVDPRPAFAAAEQVVPRGELLFKDYHPTSLGYGVLARVALAVLAEEGLVDVAAVPDPLAGVRAWRAPELELEPLVEDGRTVGLRARYGPGHRVQLFVSHERGATPVYWAGAIQVTQEQHATLELPLAFGPTLRGTIERPGRYLRSFGSDGWCEVRFHDELAAAAAAGQELWACALLVHPGQKLGALVGPLDLP